MVILFKLISLIIAIIGVGFLIGFHELGHFIFCKIFDIKTPSFSIGFGPRIFSKKIGETDFAISAIPLGGYVEMATESDSKKRDAHRLFAHKPFYQKLLVMIGGIGFNLLFAYACFFILALTGLPSSPFLHPFSAKPIVKTVEENSSAEKAGLMAGDEITHINKIPVTGTVNNLLTLVMPLAEQKVTISYERASKIHSKTVILGSRTIMGKKIGTLGVNFEAQPQKPLPLFAALSKGIEITNALIASTALSFLSLLSQGREGLSNLGSPVMVISMAMDSVSAGIKILFALLAVLSINLAVLNLIPLPILDGGQILFHSVEAAMGRPIPQRVREFIHVVTWIIVMIAFLYLTTRDTTRILTPHLQTIRSFLGI